MTLIRPNETEQGDDDVIAMASDVFKRSMSAMQALIKQWESGEAPPSTEVRKSVASVVTDMSNVLKERNRVLEERKRNVGIVGDYAIDIDAVKLEIGRKLDLLREPDRT